MPKDRDIFQAMTREIDGLSQRVRQLQRMRDLAMPIYNLSTSPPQEAIENQWALNAADGKPWFYRAGAWHIACAGEAPTGSLNTLIFTGYADENYDHPDLFVYDIDADTMTRITNVVKDGSIEFTWDAVWNGDHTELFALSDPPGFTNDVYRMNADGSNMTLVHTVTNGTSFWLFRLTNGKVYMTYRSLIAGDWHQVNVYNLTDDVPVWSYDVRNTVPSGTSNGHFVNCDGTKIAVFITVGLTWDLYIYTLPGGVANGPILDETDTSHLGVVWHPSDPTKMIYSAKVGTTPGRGVGVVNADGTGKAVIYQGVAGLGLQYRKWSPDGSKIATRYQQQIYVMNADGTGLYAIPGGITGGGLEWSPDGTQFLLAGTQFGWTQIYLKDVITGDQTKIYDGEFDGGVLWDSLGVSPWTSLSTLIL